MCKVLICLITVFLRYLKYIDDKESYLNGEPFLYKMSRIRTFSSSIIFILYHKIYVIYCVTTIYCIIKIYNHSELAWLVLVTFLNVLFLKMLIDDLVLICLGF